MRQALGSCCDPMGKCVVYLHCTLYGQDNGSVNVAVSFALERLVYNIILLSMTRSLGWQSGYFVRSSTALMMSNRLNKTFFRF